MFFTKPIKIVSPRELKIGLDAGEITLIDVREKNENQNARIEPSILLPLSSFSPNSLENHKNKKIVIYCQSGMRSANAVKKCVDAGYDVANLHGGIMNWANCGYEIARG